MTYNKILLPIAIVAFALFCTACSQSEFEPATPTDPEGVNLSIDLSSWNLMTLDGEVPATRVGEDMLYPVNVMMVEKSSAEAQKVSTYLSGTNFDISVPAGNYDIFVICGLSKEYLRKQITMPLNLPETPIGQPDFAIGTTEVTVGSSGSASPVSITAEHQTAWLDFQLTDVPSNFNTVKLYITNLTKVFTLDRKWSIPSNEANPYTQIPLTKEDDGTYTANLLITPSADPESVTYIFEVTTESSNAYYTYTTAKPLHAGTRLTQTLSFSQLAIIEGSFSINGWNNEQDNGDIENNFTFSAGQPYLSHPATIIRATQTSIAVFAHKPVSATLDVIENWNHAPLEDYDLPGVPVNRWVFPHSNTAPKALLNTIETIGLNALNSQIRASGFSPIAAEAENILAYYDEATNVFYRYDFQNIALEPVDDANAEYVIYPIGAVTLTQ